MDLADQISALADVVERQTNRLHVMVGNIRDLKFSNPTVEEVQEMARQYREEREFAHFALQEVERVVGS